MLLRAISIYQNMKRQGSTEVAERLSDALLDLESRYYSENKLEQCKNTYTEALDAVAHADDRTLGHRRRWTSTAVQVMTITELQTSQGSSHAERATYRPSALLRFSSAWRLAESLGGHVVTQFFVVNF